MNIRQVDGLRGFWRGAVPTLIRNVPGTSCYFVVLEQVRYLFLSNIHKYKFLRTLLDERKMQPNNFGNGVIASISRGISGFIFMPITVLKIRFEVLSRYVIFIYLV